MQYKENGIFIIYRPKAGKRFSMWWSIIRQRGWGSNLWFPGQKGNVIKTTCLKTCLVSKFNNKSSKGEKETIECLTLLTSP